MGFIRQEMRRHRQAELSVPHFRALVFLNHTAEASVSEMAEHLGLSLPATSRLADVLVRRGLLDRQNNAADRRRVLLSLTPRGREVFQAAMSATERALIRRFKAVPQRELTHVLMAMQALDRVFAAPNGSQER
jgi:DNA-binding MarR family transcriptional regulator